MVRQEFLLINNDKIEITHISSDHMKPYLSEDGERYTFHHSETEYEILPLWKILLRRTPKKTYKKEGFRTPNGEEYIYPYSDEKFVVVDNVVYLAAKVIVNYQYTTDKNKNERSYTFYFSNEENLNEFIDKMKKTIRNFTIIENTTDKNYKLK